MKRVGFKKMRHTVAGHADCGTCHPQTKSPKAHEKDKVKKEIGEQLEER